MNPELLAKLGALICDHHDLLPPGVPVTSLRLAMRELAHLGHLGCRVRCDSVSMIGELCDHQGGDFVSDREAKSV